ncbi:anthranilate 1,2-dioxygenase electron transfer component AntC [Burkholderia glumae]|uniref:anthranilate 1,2-dioxygenase electron transfer component AntC n=1 Tax=Burkholderia glumae TaxID=337 RepID=UPI0003AACFF5|nr:anthranilate 1,2-dioxygenase electron transfer component AntC [Burkholderia glumae]MCM2494742.1 anthranilate 1,2-dioxygenase electron transfer component AntC [Burkholderia glumae]MCM2545612.1 anthranilate 1,2-dioxygenase electron transfer component AntC [Burkholderia glumae]MCM2551434.1 anthranilate 1,2-dioxygenase electron transfer component AntC [Burkholderia glumae]MCQ0033181.1 anthranilate 1,2-dioxygenase electron transfer component AntC [Burkholderia glumae]MCQ0038933.1 anthranilate 1,
MNHRVAFSFADGKTVFFDIHKDELLLDAALRNGVNIPLDCREGVCGTCQGRCESGRYTQDYVDEETLSPADLAARKMLSCQTRVQSDASFYFDFASGLCSAAGTQSLTGRVAAVKQVSETTAILHVDASAHERRIDFLPGQYARLKVPGTDVWRSYSFANRPDDGNQLQFLIRLLPDGAMSNYLRERCAPGQTIEFEAPLGTFYLREAERPLVMVAGGTGLSAFLGMLDELAHQGGCARQVRLYYGVTHARDLCELERLTAYAQRIANFSAEIVVMNASDGWQGKTGLIPEHFDRDMLAAAPFDMYVCGPPPMVEAIKTWLARERVSDHRLYYEKFAESNSAQQAA